MASTEPGRGATTWRPSLRSRHLRSLGGKGARGLVADTAGTVVLNASTVALNLVLTLLLTRLLGAAGFGAYASAYAWAAVLSVVGVLGLSPLVIRTVAAYESAGSWDLLRGVLRRTNQVVLASSAVVIGIAAVVGLVAYRNNESLLHPYLVALLIVPVIALTTLRQSAMVGLRRVLLGRLPETVLAPLLFIVLVLLGWLLLDDNLSATWAVALQFVGLLCAFGLGSLFLRRSLPSGARAAAPAYETRAWIRSGLPLLVLNVLMAANAQVGTILVAALGTTAEAGVFNVASRMTTIIGFLAIAATYPLMPLVARLHTAGQDLELQSTVQRSARAVLLWSAPVALLAVVFAHQLLRLFGSEFPDAVDAVRILAVGELVKAAIGFSGLVLVMCGREADLTKGVALWTGMNIALSAALIPSLGANGAAVGVAASAIVGNLYLLWRAHRKLGILAAPFGASRGV